MARYATPQQYAHFTLINLYSTGVFSFQYFPTDVTTEDGANWEAHDVTHGIKPLSYANREPQRITFNAWLDHSAANESIQPVIDELRLLMSDNGPEGTPAPLLLVCGDWRERVVLERLHVKRTLFNSDNLAIRAEVSLTLAELAEEELRFSPPRLMRRRNPGGGS